jgi:hypothetical protein
MRTGSVTAGAREEVDALFSKAYDQTKIKYSPNVPFEQAVSKDDLDTLRHAFTHFNFPDIFPQAKVVVADEVKTPSTTAASLADEKSTSATKAAFLYDALGTVVIGLVLMGCLELFRAYSNA